MENRDYREEIGKKLEEALELGDFSEFEDLIEMPSPETFAKWTELGVEKHNKRVRRKRTLAACAIFIVVCVSALIAIKCIAPPEVEAGPDDKIGIDNSMDRTITYESWSDLPNDIQEQFMEVKNLPDGYVVEDIVLKDGSNAIKLEISLNFDENIVIIRQAKQKNGGLPTVLVTNENKKLNLNGIELYLESKPSVGTTTYKYISDDILIDLIAPSNLNYGKIEALILSIG